MEVVAPVQVGLSSKRLERVKAWLEHQVASEKLAGASVLIGRHGKPAFFETTGSAEIEKGIAFNKDTVVRIFSMTKPITSVAAMMLYEEGCFHLDEPIANFLPEFKDTPVWTGSGDISSTVPQESPIQVKHVFTHTSGLTYGFMNTNVVDEEYRRREIQSPSPHVDLEAWIKDAAEIPLICQPGSEWNYSISTDVLGRLVEVWSGQTLDEFFRKRIFEPLDMTDTGFHVIAKNMGRFAACYEPRVGGKLGTKAENLPPLSERGGLKLYEASEGSRFLRPDRVFSGGGGLVSTMRDYSRFCQMLMNRGELDGERLLAPTTVNYMRTNQLPDNKDMAAMGQPVWSETNYDGIGFGLGFAVVLDPVKASIITSVGEHHWGGAASTFFWLDPVQDMWVVFLTQLLPSSTYPIRRELRTLVYQAIDE